MTTNKKTNNTNTATWNDSGINVQQYAALQALFNYYNVKLFKGSLPECILTLNRERNTCGYFVPAEGWQDKKGNKYNEIALNPDYMLHEKNTDKEIMAVLIHEMVHLWQHYDGSEPRRCYHNKDFAEKMESVGLITSHTGKEGGKRTGQRMSHYIQAGGVFEKAFEEMPEDLFIPYKTLFKLQGDKKKIVRKQVKRVTYTCPICDATVKGKEGLHILCGDCQEEMQVNLK